MGFGLLAISTACGLAVRVLTSNAGGLCVVGRAESGGQHTSGPSAVAIPQARRRSVPIHDEKNDAGRRNCPNDTTQLEMEF